MGAPGKIEHMRDCEGKRLVSFKGTQTEGGPGWEGRGTIRKKDKESRQTAGKRGTSFMSHDAIRWEWGKDPWGKSLV